jgi:transcriptional regulator with XRE-family HTH domain
MLRAHDVYGLLTHGLCFVFNNYGVPPMKAADWIDRIKVVKHWESDYRVAKELGVSRNTISTYRAGRSNTMDEDTSVMVASSLGINPVIVLVDQALERAKNDDARRSWAEVIKSLFRNEKAPQLAGLGIGGNGGIRTLDEALHPILP